MRYSYLLLLLLVMSLDTVFAQNIGRIEDKLSRLFETGHHEKCLKKAERYQRKYPQLDVPVYYISKVNLQKYKSDSLQGRSAYKHLTLAVCYAEKLPESFVGYKAKIRNTLKVYVVANHDTARISPANKRAVQLYTITYGDTLEMYFQYFPSLSKGVDSSLPILFQSKSDSLRVELIQFAQSLEGTKYKYAGEKPETGFDCSGFTKYAFGHIGIELPHNAHKQSQISGLNKPLTEAQIGDLIFFGSGNETDYRTQHAGIILSVNDHEIKVIHCVSGGVSIDGNNSSFDMYWKDRILFVKSPAVFNVQ